MLKSRKPLPLAIAVFGLVALACTCARTPSLPLAPTATPAPTVAVSTAAADEMQKKIDQAEQDLSTKGQFQTTLSESEISSYLARQVQDAQAQGNSIPISNPRVKLTQGQVWLYGTYQAGPAGPLDGLVVLSPQVQNGRLFTRVVRADFGAIPVPAPLLDQVNQQLQKMSDDQARQDPTIVLTGLNVREGQLDISGARK